MLTIETIVNSAEYLTFELICYFIVFGVIVILAQSVSQSIAGYIFFRIDRYVSIDTSVEIYGKRGIIKNATIFGVTVETCDGFLHVATKNWKDSGYMVLKDKQKCIIEN